MIVKIDKKVHEIVEKDVTMFVTSDGKEFVYEKNAETHEDILKRFPKLNEHTIAWIEKFIHEDEAPELDQIEKDFKSGNAIILIEHSGGGELCYEVVDPNLITVKCIIKVLHRKVQGCNYTQFVRGIVYKGEDLCFKEERKIDGKDYYITGFGKDIDEVL
jgi:predicted peroxiredoxin